MWTCTSKRYSLVGYDPVMKAWKFTNVSNTDNALDVVTSFVSRCKFINLRDHEVHHLMEDGRSVVVKDRMA